jgi:hypothetical protein
MRKNLIPEITQEFLIAGNILSREGRSPETGTKVSDRTHSQYCREIGSCKRVVTGTIESLWQNAGPLNKNDPICPFLYQCLALPFSVF